VHTSSNVHRGLVRSISIVAAIGLASYLAHRLRRWMREQRVLLFDNIERTEQRPKREREPIYDYYNSSARPLIAAVRAVLQQWFDAYPAPKKDLLARLRSPLDAQHKSAFWELYLHELLSQMKYRLRTHPSLRGSNNNPDFLVCGGDKPKFYLEAIIAGLPSAKDAGAEARLSEVFDLVNKMQTPHYFLEVQYRGSPKTPPPVAKLRKSLTLWLGSLDFPAIDAACKAENFDILPKFEWNHDGLTLFFCPIPKSEKTRGTADAGTIDGGMGVRQPNGVWFGKKGARNRNLSAVLIGCQIDPYMSGSITPQLIHNPYAENPLVLPSYPLPQSLPDRDSSTMRKSDGRRASEFLRLPSPWPPDHD
jgi:hypothetical protein